MDRGEPIWTESVGPVYGIREIGEALRVWLRLNEIPVGRGIVLINVREQGADLMSLSAEPWGTAQVQHIVMQTARFIAEGIVEGQDRIT